MIISEEKIKALFTTTKDKMPYFTKRTYETAFLKFLADNESTFSDIESLYEGKSDDEKDALAENIASDFISVFKAEYDAINKKGKKKSYVTEHNSAMVIFVFPGLLRQETYGKALCEKIVPKWNETFSEATISYGTFEEINSGFRTSILSIFKTAFD